MKKLRLVITGALLAGAITLVAPHPKVVNSNGAPIKGANNSCTYANGIVRLCPDTLVYNAVMKPDASIQSTPPVNNQPVAQTTPVDPVQPVTDIPTTNTPDPTTATPSVPSAAPSVPATPDLGIVDTSTQGPHTITARLAH